jgi:hypothetical protein
MLRVDAKLGCESLNKRITETPGLSVPEISSGAPGVVANAPTPTLPFEATVRI